MFEPVNGYQIRRELVSWRVDKWAHVNPGSIYHGLSALTAEGHLTRNDLVDGTREVAVYEVTPAGRALLEEMMVEALESVDPYDRTVFTIAFGMLPLLDRQRVLAGLVTRRAALEREVDTFVRGKDDPANGPPHARRGWVLWLDLAIAELAWLRETDRGGPQREAAVRARRGLGLAAAGRRPGPPDDRSTGRNIARFCAADLSGSVACRPS